MFHLTDLVHWLVSYDHHATHGVYQQGFKNFQCLTSVADKYSDLKHKREMTSSRCQ